jgi:DNA-binding transcriptional MocR family regulator
MVAVPAGAVGGTPKSQDGCQRGDTIQFKVFCTDPTNAKIGAAMRRYEELADFIARQIKRGVVRPGDRLLSVRRMRRLRRVSPATVTRAYQVLEGQGLLEARPRAGHFVTPRLHQRLPEPSVSKPLSGTRAAAVDDALFEAFKALQNEDVVSLAAQYPRPELLPVAKLAKYMAAACRRMTPRSLCQGHAPGLSELRRQIARRYLRSEIEISPDEIIITAGGREAMNLCLLAVVRPGDVIAVESPASVAATFMMNSYGVKTVPLPTHPSEGIELGPLETAIREQGAKACWLMSNVQDPLGGIMPQKKKKDLAALLKRHRVPLIEDDVFAELYYGSERPSPIKRFDSEGLVLHCGSFSKSLALGLRVGWVAPGRFYEDVWRRKVLFSTSTNVFAESAIDQYLKYGGYDRHLRSMRAQLEQLALRMQEAVTRYFPSHSLMTRPVGGYFLWVQIPNVDTFELYKQAMDERIAVSPGAPFCGAGTFDDCIRLNYGAPWTTETEKALRKLGAIAHKLEGSLRNRAPSRTYPS